MRTLPRLGLASCLVFSLIAANAASVHRWTDTAGRTHYGDRPPAGSKTTAITIQAKRPWKRVTVAKVLDGDSFRTTANERVRLLGINSPERAHRGKPGEAFAEEAFTSLNRLLNGAPIDIRRGQRERDDYGRILAYARSATGIDIAEHLLQKGLARLDIREPNTLFWQNYAKAERQARLAGRGIWTLEDFQIKSIAELAQRRNRFTRVGVTLDRIEYQGKFVELILSDDFRVRIDADNDSLTDWAKSQRVGTELVIRGVIRQKNGRPILYLRHLSQIEESP